MHLFRLIPIAFSLGVTCAFAQEIQLDPSRQGNLEIVGPDFALGETPPVSDTTKLPQGARWLGTDKQVLMMLSPDGAAGSLNLSDPRFQSVRCVRTCVTGPDGSQVCFPVCSNDLNDFSLGVLQR